MRRNALASARASVTSRSERRHPSDGPIGKQPKPPPGDFSSAESKKKSEAELLDGIQKGKPKIAMVAWKEQLTEAEIQDVPAYVLTLRK